jgi:hypothetical protein
VRIVREGHKGLVVLPSVRSLLKNEAEVFQQTEKYRIEIPSPEHRFRPKFRSSLVGRAVELESHACAYTRFLRYSAWDTHAVYDPVLSLWPFSQVPLHRLRLDLLYPESLFSYCPSRRRGKGEGTVRGSPLLRVFKQNSEEVAGSFSQNSKDWLKAARTAPVKPSPEAAICPIDS